MLNMRSATKVTRQYSISQDGGETWGAVKEDFALTDPQCQGSLLAAQPAEKPVLLFANPASVERANMSIKMSLDEGKSWTKKYLVHAGPSAYSDLVMISDTEVGIMYEGGKGRPYEGLAFEIVSLEKLK